jgi:N-methylhydantoinase B
MSMITERNLFPANGIAGGRRGNLRKTVVNDGEVPHPKMQIFFPPGSRIYNRTPGGGGYGNPLERDPLRVSQDVRLGLVSFEKAREDYGVVLDPKTGEPLTEETRKLRGERTHG